MLEFENVSRKFRGPEGDVSALRDASLHIAPGELVAVQGPSGCGKTTLLLVAGTLLRPTQGDVLLDGQKPYALNANQRSIFRSRTVGFVFQQFHLVPYLSVRENVLAPSAALPSSDASSRADELIKHFGLGHRAKHLPSQLSSGERQRTALARALLNRPKLILADEPTGNLDPESAEVVASYLSEFVRDGGAVLLVTHDARAAVYADRTLHMRAGELDRDPVTKKPTEETP